MSVLWCPFALPITPKAGVPGTPVLQVIVMIRMGKFNTRLI